MDKQVIELAIEALEKRKQDIDLQIQNLRSQLKTSPAPKKRGRKPLTPAQRKAQSQKMKAYWQEKRKQQSQSEKPKAKSKS